ncbi:MAG: phosphoglucosamine mutase [Gammaproteobacteria bacterium]|nr:phosphoglucosamine mutase [Gammaproteobacteria bacterium]MBU1556175.1 phosphoglucosamine mutase [Gammaproteobacteria bacterium]MBU2070436.1 phosphoglucosamine mutase [Gammaproteobacteria bacterium]MBU2184702.1 phosphoglucosamine mutase [Gammaproteobacteria bacterium]MBU2206724.1 phosphoglucosamine mutase [Gammaproteobacteria bacterium]
MSRKYFGTDGVRGRVGDFPITPEFAMKLGWAAGRVLSQRGTRKVLIGKDTRISGYLLETALEAGLIAAGIDVRLLGPMPTPAVAYLTRTFRAEAGIVISASHNPYYDNGIKFFSADGTKLPDEVELAIEYELEQPMLCQPSEKLGKATRIDDAAGRYIEFCKSHLPNHMSLNGLNIVIDCAHGATYHIAPAVFKELGAAVTVIGATPDGFNINDHCGATHTELLQKTVLETKADLGIAYDGDGDRVMLVDHSGRVIDGDEIVYIIARAAKAQHKLQGGVVGTLMSNLGLELALKELDIPFARSAVGDRYVMELLREKNWRIGGENSGHVLNLDHTCTGDGIIASLQVLTAMIEAGLSLAEFSQGMHKLPQVLLNVKFEKGTAPLEKQHVKQVIAQVEAELNGSGRVLIRKSGTEPLIRVMVEGEDETQVRQYAERIAAAVKIAS